MLWIAAALILLLVGLFVNLVHLSSHARALAFDHAYIAKHCDALFGEQAADIHNDIEPLGAFIGTDYHLFDRSTDGTPVNHRLIALRDDYQEALCFPRIGCLIPPYLRAPCWGA